MDDTFTVFVAIGFEILLVVAQKLSQVECWVIWDDDDFNSNVSERGNLDSWRMSTLLCFECDKEMEIKLFHETTSKLRIFINLSIESHQNGIFHHPTIQQQFTRINQKLSRSIHTLRTHSKDSQKSKWDSSNEFLMFLLLCWISFSFSASLSRPKRS